MAFKRPGPSSTKAKQMLKDDSAQGHKLTSAQKGLFGAIAGGSSKKVPPGGKGPAIGERPVQQKTMSKMLKK
jgi:hypothetical protein